MYALPLYYFVSPTESFVISTGCVSHVLPDMWLTCSLAVVPIALSICAHTFHRNNDQIHSRKKFACLISG